MAFSRNSERLIEIGREQAKLAEVQVRLRRAITALAAMCSESPYFDKYGITDACFEVMEQETEEITTQDVLAKLEELGFDLSSQKNPSASVHAVLSRLADREKIGKELGEGGAVTWRGPKYHEGYAYSTEITDEDIPF